MVLDDERRVELLLEHVAEQVREELKDAPDLGPRLTDQLNAARRAWPDVSLDDDRFIPHLAGHVAPRGDGSCLRSMRVDDLYLACACGLGDAAAVAAFEARYGPEIDHALRRLRAPADLWDEIRQQVAEHLLVGRGGKPPHLMTYRGHGHLGRWVALIAARTAIKAITRRGLEVPAHDLVQASPAVEDDPEIAYMGRLYRREFREAFREATRDLSSRDRNLLRYYYLNELTLGEIGSIYGVHEATASRWLSRVRAELLTSTRRGLMERLDLDPEQYDSIMRLVQGQLEASLRSLWETE